jgi:methionine-rich copper-binding protein CopC
MRALVLLASTLLATATAFAHARLQSSTPADGATLAPAPGELRLTYDEPVEAAVSSVRLTGPDGAVVPTGKPGADKDDARTLVLRLPALRAGAYRAEWATMGRDGHRTHGEVRFTVK